MGAVLMITADNVDREQTLRTLLTGQSPWSVSVSMICKYGCWTSL